jgi:NADPH:quinone reductase-like Zn-dependent oxidoreductase
MTRTGVYAAVGAKGTRWFQPVARMLAVLAVNPLVPQTMTTVDVINAPDVKRHLLTVFGLIEEGRVTPVIDRVHSFAEIPEALRYQEEGHATGKVVVTVRAD